MLSDEEKQALKELIEIKELVEEDLKYKDYEVAATLDQIDLESLVIVLNLIEKQSKEIEDNKKYIDLHYVPYEQYTSKLNELNKKWKDKIKAKIEYLLKRYDTEEDFCSYDVLISILKSLLEKE